MGAFVLLGVAVLMALVLVLSDVSFESSTRIHVDYNYSGGLKVGAPVKMSGISIGRVEALSLVDEAMGPAAPRDDLGRNAPARVRATLDLESAVAQTLTDDCRFYVGMQGLIGEAYVEAARGGGGQMMEEGAVVRGVDAPKLHVMILRLSNTLGTLTRLLGSTDESDLGELGQSVASLLKTLDEVLGQNKEELGKAVKDLAASATELREISIAMARALGNGDKLERLIDDGSAIAGTLRARVPALLARAEETLNEVEGLTKSLKDSADPVVLEATLKDVREASERLALVARDAQILTESVRRGEGTIGALLSDATIYEDVKELLRDLKRHPWKLLYRE